jgi:hypothetical protein
VFVSEYIISKWKSLFRQCMYNYKVTCIVFHALYIIHTHTIIFLFSVASLFTFFM